MFARFGKKPYLCTRKKRKGAIAQLVEQRTENPCVPGSIPGGTTKRKALDKLCLMFFLFLHTPHSIFANIASIVINL